MTHQAEYTGMVSHLQEMRVDISRFIDKVLKSSRAIDRESLCIVQGRLAWQVTIEIIVINEDGNLMDACFMAALSALMNTRLPEVNITREKIKINSEKLKYMNVHHIPVCTTFYFIENFNQPIIDANAKEEKLSSARLSICMNIFEDLCGMSTLGSLEVDPEFIISCSHTCVQISKEITQKVRDAFAKRHQNPILDFSASFGSIKEQITQENHIKAEQFLQNVLGDIDMDAQDEDQ